MNESLIDMKRKANDSESLWSSLFAELLVKIFSYLPTKDICNCCIVSSHWNSVSSSNDVWKLLCMNDWLIFKSTNKTYKEIYMELYKEFGIYMNCYIHIKGIWNQLEEWLSINAPQVLKRLNPGASEERLKKFEEEIGIQLPLEIRCSYRIHDGQRFPEERSDESIYAGLFGGYKCYDWHVNLFLSNLEYMGNYCKLIRRRTLFEWIRHSIPIVASYNNVKNFFCLLDNKRQGSIVEPTTNKKYVVPVAENFIGLLEDLKNNLLTGNYLPSKKHKEITRYPSKIGVSQATTNGVCITASPLFCAERSQVSPPRSYFFAYKIRMTMDPSRSQSERCKLASRHWIITDETNHVEEVQGEGVIGKYPEMYPGADFEYASCCPIRTPKGSMRGSLHMVNILSRNEFDAEVAHYDFIAPPILDL